MVEANRLWFYSLLFSITQESTQFFSMEGGNLRAVDANVKVGPHIRTAGEQSRAKERRRILFRGLLTDFFDLFIPGHVTGWIYTSSAFVGFASAVSTLLASKSIWDRLKDR